MQSMKISLTPEQKFDILKEVYAENRKEIAFWRERSWKVTTWLIGSMLAISSASVFSGTSYPALAAPLLGLSIIASIYLHKNYRVYSERWQRLAAIEEALGFFEPDCYVEGKSLHPEELKRPRVTYRGTAFFIAAIWVIAVCSIVALVLKKGV
jgi:hypothetical protein